MVENSNANHSAIPEHYKQFCENPKIGILSCDFYMHKDCPNTCYFAKRIKQGISHLAKTGLERHLAKKERAKQKGFDWDGGE